MKRSGNMGLLYPTKGYEQQRNKTNNEGRTGNTIKGVM